MTYDARRTGFPLVCKTPAQRKKTDISGQYDPVVATPTPPPYIPLYRKILPNFCNGVCRCGLGRVGLVEASLGVFVPHSGTFGKDLVTIS